MLEVNRLSVSLSKKKILSDLSFALEGGTVTALIGKNGSGKSTLLRALAGLIPAQGNITLGGTDVSSLSPRERARRMAFLPQVLAAPHMTVEELTTLGRHPHLSPFSRLNAEEREAVCAAMERADVSELSKSYLDEISGGERQRAYLSMLLSQNAPLWLLDEPTTYMDLSVANRLTALLNRLKKENGKTLLVAMHDLSSAVRNADRLLLLDEGKCIFFGTVREALDTDIIERSFSVRRITAEGEIFFVGQ